MARILYPATANFGRGKDKKKRKKRGFWSTTNEYLGSNEAKTGIKAGLATGGALGAYAGGSHVRTLLQDPKFAQKLMATTRAQRMAAIGGGAIGGGLVTAGRLGAAGALIGAGVYGARKLMNRNKKRGR